jgi:hypothetical protein
MFISSLSFPMSFAELLVLLGFYYFPCLLYMCRCKVQIIDKGRQGEKRRCNMEELQPLDLAIWRVEKVDFFIITKYKSKMMVL